jgi:hypothetical protein
MIWLRQVLTETTPPIKLTATIIAEILLKAAINTLTLTITPYTFYSSSIYSSIIKEEFEDTKGVIRIRISKKNRQHNCQKKKYKSTKGQTTIYKAYI